MLRALVTLVLLLSGCRIKEDKWPDKVAKAQCDFYARCDRTWYFHNFESRAECLDWSNDGWTQLAEQYEGCIFNPKNARKCLKGLGSSCKHIGRDYDTLEETCYEVWDCGDEFLESTDTAPEVAPL